MGIWIDGSCVCGLVSIAAQLVEMGGGGGREERGCRCRSRRGSPRSSQQRRSRVVPSTPQGKKKKKRCAFTIAIAWLNGRESHARRSGGSHYPELRSLASNSAIANSLVCSIPSSLLPPLPPRICLKAQQPCRVPPSRCVLQPYLATTSTQASRPPSPPPSRNPEGRPAGPRETTCKNR